MRISTNTLFESGVARLNELQSGLLKTQQQISTGRRILTPADDPVAAARALEVTQGQNTNAQFASNRQNVKDSLRQEEGILQSVTSLIQDVKTLTVQAGGALDDAQRKFIAKDLQGRVDELLGLANSRDATGNYVFGGFQATVQPYAQIATGVQYRGDQGQRLLQVGATRQMALSDSGDAIFENAKTGNGTFVTAAATALMGGVMVPSNTGSGVVSSGAVVDATALTGDNYEIVFSAGGATYSVFDVTLDPTKTGAPLVTGSYTSGQAITFDGIQVDVTGTPADGDIFTVQPSTKQSIFTTLNNLINVLNGATTGELGNANLSNGLKSAHTNLDNSLDNILTVRASVGARLKEIDALDSAGEDRSLQYAQTLEDLQGLDYPKAMTDLTQQQFVLEAAQKSFAKVAGLSLFDFI